MERRTFDGHLPLRAAAAPVPVRGLRRPLGQRLPGSPGGFRTRAPEHQHFCAAPWGRKLRPAVVRTRAAAPDSPGELPLPALAPGPGMARASCSPVTRRPEETPDFLAPSLHHEVHCASRSALVAAYTSVSEAPWVESCAVDLPNLRLALRVSAARPCRRMVEWLQRIEHLAQGLPPNC